MYVYRNKNIPFYLSASQNKIKNKLEKAQKTFFFKILVISFILKIFFISDMKECIIFAGNQSSKSLFFGTLLESSLNVPEKGCNYDLKVRSSKTTQPILNFFTPNIV